MWVGWEGEKGSNVGINKFLGVNVYVDKSYDLICGFSSLCVM